MSVTKLNFNNGTAPALTPTNSVALREYAGGPMAQQDAEYNFINITDRVNKLIDQDDSKQAAIDQITSDLGDLDTKVEDNATNIPVFEYDESTKTLTITSSNA